MTGTYQQLLCRLCAAALLVCLLSSLCACGDAACPAPAQVVSDHVIASLPAGQTESREQYPCLTGQQDSLRITGALPTMTRGKYDVGSCRRLEGKPYVLVIFLDDDVSSWSEQEVIAYWDNLILPALSFMEENAAQWDVELEFQRGFYATYGHPHIPVKYDGIVDTFNEGTTSKDILDQAAAALGFASKEDLHERMMELSGQEQVAYVVMLNKGGRSYSSCYANPGSGLTPGPENYYLEHSVIYTGFTDTSRDSASDTVAHEMLHLFGAEDYYYPESRRKLAQQLYPEDIMLCEMSDLAYFRVGDFTAYTVGWTDAMPSVCRNPDWW